MFDALLERFAQTCPLAVMARITLERLLDPAWVDQVFAEHRQRQYQKELAFSAIVDVTSVVALGLRPSLHAAFRKANLDVSFQALYGKINRTEPALMRALVRGSYQHLAPLLGTLRAGREPLLPGWRVRILDGNELPACEKRLSPLRGYRGPAMPGQSLVIYDPDLGLVCDLLPCEDAHTNERKILLEGSDVFEQGTLYVGDRGLNSRHIAHAVAQKKAFFLFREQPSSPNPTERGPLKRLGRIEGGVVYAQWVDIPAEATKKKRKGKPLRARRIVLELDEPLESGETVIRLLTNVPAKKVKATVLAALYRKRWLIEGLFQRLEACLESEVRSLGRPGGALLCFSVAVVAYNLLEVLQAAVEKAHPICAEQPISTFYIASELRETYVGMTRVVPEQAWEAYSGLSDKQLAQTLVRLAKRVEPAELRKSPRGPKPKKKKGYAPRAAVRRQVATRRVLDAGTTDYDGGC